MKASIGTLSLILAIGWLGAPHASAAMLWIEAEKPAVNQMARHPWWYDKVKKAELSGGDFLSNWSQEKVGEAEYRFEAPAAGEYTLWLRANPVQSTMSFLVNGAAEQAVNFRGEKRGEVNIAEDGKPDLRFLAWINAGKVTLKSGPNSLRIRMTSQNNHHGMLDCFVLANEPFLPQGIRRPGEIAKANAQLLAESKGWLPFDPKPDGFTDSPIDLRFLNEKEAGANGFIAAKDGQFVHSGTGQPVVFWAVNGPPGELRDRAAIRRAARALAKRGVNLVRVHGAVFDKNGEPDLAKVKHIHEVVEEMKAEGIYTHVSIYFPLWFRPSADLAWLPGYNGQKHPFATLLFNPQFQEKYQAWWRALLLTPSEKTGRRLIDEPALFGAELQNEDSLFFWTFSEQNIPDPQLRILEKMFGDWLARRHGSVAAALAKWGGAGLKRDNPAQGRVAFRPLWNIFNEKRARDQETARFLFELQTQFYTAHHQFLRKLGFKGLICGSNWSTASPEVFGPLEAWSYTAGDFVDRHGYFGCNHKGENAEWSIRDGHTYSDRSALRFDSEAPGKAKQFVHPVMDIEYNRQPTMISETTFTRPNRYRSEAALYYAAYAALQGSDCVVHFAFDGAGWQVKPNFWMQQWTLMSPAMIGQFPAAALIYRQGLVAPGRVLADIRLNQEDLLALKGTPLPLGASFDELRLKDVPAGLEVKPGQRIDPLLHYAGRATVQFVKEPGSVKLGDLKPLIDHERQMVTSSTGELQLDYRRGVLTLNAAKAQGVCGALKANGPAELRDVAIASELELGAIVAVPLDGRPLANSQKILLQVMSEEKNSDFQTEPAGELKRIVKIGRDPWLFRELSGTVRFKRADAAQLKVQALDLNGYPGGAAGNASNIKLQSGTVYYYIAP